MKLDGPHLRACKELTDVDVVNHIVGDNAEGASQASDDASLFAVRDMVAAHDMATDGLLGPRDRMGVRTFDRLDITLRRISRGVVKLIAMFAKCNSGTDRVADRVVLNDPAFAPVRAIRPICSAVGGAHGVAA